MGIALVQHSSISSSGYGVSHAFSSATTTGNIIIVGVRIGDQGLTSTAVTDDAGNSYQLATSCYIATLGTGYIFYAKNATATTTITCTVTGGSSPTNRFCHYEYRGCDKSNPFDVSACQNLLATTTPDSGNIVTNYPQELLFGMCNVSNSRTISAGSSIAWTLQEQLPTGAGSGKIGIEDFITSSAGTYHADFSLNSSDDALTLLASFKQSSIGYSRMLLGVGV